MDIYSVISTIALAKDGIKGIKALCEASKDLDKKLFSIGILKELVKLEENVLEIESKNVELARQLQIKEELQLDNDSKVYWRIKNGQKEGPFCSTCYEDSSKVIPLIQNCKDSWYCPKCKNRFQTQKSREDQHERAIRTICGPNGRVY